MKPIVLQAPGPTSLSNVLLPVQCSAARISLGRFKKMAEVSRIDDTSQTPCSSHTEKKSSSTNHPLRKTLDLLPITATFVRRSITMDSSKGLCCCAHLLPERNVKHNHPWNINREAACECDGDRWCGYGLYFFHRASREAAPAAHAVQASHQLSHLWDASSAGCRLFAQSRFRA